MIDCLSGLSPIVVVGPTVEPVTLAQAKLQCKLEPDEVTPEDSLMELEIAAARRWCESATGMAFYEQTLKVVLNCWPSSYRRGVVLPRATPLQSIEEVTYRDEDETALVLDTGTYFADTNSIPGRLVLRSGESWPSDSLSPSGAIAITYIAGAEVDASPNPIPPSCTMAILLLVEHLYRNRGAVVVGNPAAVASAAITFGVDAFLSEHIQGYGF